MFLIVTIIGFLPAKEGILFGGMYKSSALTMLMKNILNVGVLIVLIQSASWLKREDLQAVLFYARESIDHSEVRAVNA